MIKRIVLRDVASYDHEGVTFDNLSKVNFIYGVNGTGKTTFSRVLNGCNDGNGYGVPSRMRIIMPRMFPTCEVAHDDEFIKVWVYNKDFRENNLKETIPGIFVLGDDFFDDISEVIGGVKWEIKEWTEKSEKKIELDRTIGVLNKQIEQKERELRNLLWEEFYVPNKDLKGLLEGYNRKASFTERIRLFQKTRRYEKGIEWDVYKDIEAIRKQYKEQYECKKKRKLAIFQKDGTKLLDSDSLDVIFWHYLAWKSEDIVKKKESEIELLIKEKEECQRTFEQEQRSLDSRELPEQNEGEKSAYAIVHPVFDSINESLRLHGYMGFRIQPSPLGNNEFQIQREDGSYVKDTLSEGEETIITFLYFMQVVTGFLVQGEKNTCNKVVVIDDPISSLDYDAIDLVSTLTNDLIKKARKGEDHIEQVIVLTHNTSYHKSLCVNQPRKGTRYWKLYRRKGVSKAKAYGEDNPIRGEYEELWAKLGDLRDDATEFKVALPNLMRRIIETYFVEYGGLERHKLFAGEYVRKKEEKQAVVALMKWIDEGSHCVRDINGCSDIDDSCERFFNLFEKTFEAMGHEAHYKMMMREP